MQWYFLLSKKKRTFDLFSLPRTPLLEEILAKTHRWDRLQFPLELPWPFQVLFIRAGLSNSRAEGTGGDISRVPAWTRAARVPGLTEGDG